MSCRQRTWLAGSGQGRCLPWRFLRRRGCSGGLCPAGNGAESEIGMLTALYTEIRLGGLKCKGHKPRSLIGFVQIESGGNSNAEPVRLLFFPESRNRASLPCLPGHGDLPIVSVRRRRTSCSSNDIGLVVCVCARTSRTGPRHQVRAARKLRVPALRRRRRWQGRR